MQVFDTAAVPPRERADAVSDAMLEATLSTQLVHHDPHDVWLRIEEHQLGSVSLTHVVTSGMDTTRTRRQTAADSTPVIALSMGMARGSVLERYGEQRRTTPGAVNLVELTEPYRSRIARGTDGWSVKIPLEQLAVPHSTIRKASPGLSASPVHPVFAHHLRSLARQAPRLDGDGARALLGTATIALARALICSAADDSRRIDEAMTDSLLIRVQTYVSAHLTDPGLTPERIAAAHHVSLRQLYRTCAAADLRLEQWIIGLRLEGARQDLARPRSRSRTIAAVARHWCFINPSHFAQRFREAYGVTPREWQAGTEGAAPGSHGTSRVASG
jgi:AraC-like DNA-binding protein